MRLELKTENKNHSKSFLFFFGIFFVLAQLIIIFDISLKLGIISRHYQIEYNCRLLSFKNSTTNFKRISKLSNLKSKQRIRELCRDVVK